MKNFLFSRYDVKSLYINKGAIMKSFKALSLALAGLTVAAFAASEASYPSDWKSYTSVETPLMKAGGALPGCDADVSSLPEHYQKTVATYCAVTPTGPGKVEILVKPSALPVYKAFTGKFKKGDSTILHLKDLKILFVTGYDAAGAPLYGVYDESGKDMSGAEGSGLHPQDCRKCHTGYAAYGANGQMGKL